MDEAYGLARTTLSLNQTFGTDGEPTELGDLLPDTRVEMPEDELEQIQRRRVVRRALKTLPDRERVILERHFGLAGEPQTLQEIGRQLGLTRERVRQLEAHALATLSREPELSTPAAAASAASVRRRRPTRVRAPATPDSSAARATASATAGATSRLNMLGIT